MTLDGWVARPDAETFLGMLPAEQAERWELVLATVDAPEILVRAHLGERGALRRVEYVVRGDANGLLLQRSHAVEFGARGRSFSTNPDDGAPVRDLRGTIGA